jgi:coiled-coil domain-containing protein 12
LSAASDDRKARLAKLKSLKRKQPEDEVVPPESDRASPSPPEKDVARLHLSGRNYDPETRGAKLGFESAPTLGPDKQTLEEQAAELEEEVTRTAAEEAENDKGIDLFKLQPKKPNWDLKRELNQKLDVLNVRTDNAIARLVRERLSTKKSVSEAASTEGGADGGLEGAALVEGLRLREKEEEEEERRQREEDDMA